MYCKWGGSMSKKTIAIIGVGALGLRHLQSVSELDKTLNIYVIDNNSEAIENAMQQCKREIIGGKNISILPEEIDVAIIATTSNVRRQIFEQLVAHSKIGNVIFEKVLFQKVDDYYVVERLLKEHNIRAWVNCARREYDSYHIVKKLLSDCESYVFHMAGGNWGMACNGIHMVDLVEFLEGSEQCAIEQMNLQPVIEDSKRSGYKEVYGTITGKCGRCESFSITCFKNSTVPTQIDIVSDAFRCTIVESERQLILASGENAWKEEKRSFAVPYQSQLTGGVVKNILESGTCRLPEYQDAMRLHLEFIKPLIQFFEKRGMERDVCPIT